MKFKFLEIQSTCYSINNDFPFGTTESNIFLLDVITTLSLSIELDLSSKKFYLH